MSGGDCGFMADVLEVSHHSRKSLTIHSRKEKRSFFDECHTSSFFRVSVRGKEGVEVTILYFVGEKRIPGDY